MLLNCPHCGTTNRVPTLKLNLAPKCGHCSKSLTNHPIELNKNNFHEIITECPTPVLIDFWADWCRPCKNFAPVFLNAAKTHNSKIILGKIDTEKEIAVSNQFQIRSIPTLISFKSGKEIGRITGALSDQQLNQLINKICN